MSFGPKGHKKTFIAKTAIKVLLFKCIRGFKKIEIVAYCYSLDRTAYAA